MLRVPALSLGGVYSRQSANDFIQIRLKIGLGHIKNRYAHEAWVLMPDIRLSWVKKLVTDRQYGTFWAGLCLPHQMVNLFFESWDDAHLYWLNAYGLGPSFRWHKVISIRDQIIFRTEFPLFSWISRPYSYRYKKQEPLNHLTYHFTEPNRALHLKNITDYRSFFIQILFRRQMTASLLNFGIEFQYTYCRLPEEISGYQTFLIFSYQWRI